MSTWLRVVSLLLSLSGWCCQPVAAQAPPGPRQVAFEDLDSLMRAEPRPVAVFLHTEWCTYCRHMKHSTFLDPEVVATLDRDWYFVSFDGESKEPVTWRGHRFAYRPRGRNTGVHTLAEALGTAGDGSLSYPTLVLLSREFEILFQYDAFLSAPMMLKILREVRQQEGGPDRCH